ncbi:aldose epimerase family protein [Paracoccus sp. (in: a-proteobacteria)]|uniref:aldose epimerase family protein n=1 Tax=Paracoccus sp. TaxID=267 RepID=UPI0028A7A839|nr:aldose epimerase family protein [Paracoccus sp. (in: a-proteobacteria)]
MPEKFGTLADGRPVMRATISGHGLTASFITLGASLQDLRLTGVGHSLVLGFPELDPYLDEGRYFGAVIGRYANRIAQGRAVIDGQEWQLDRNQDGRHLLHGGSDGCGTRNWMLADWDKNSVALADYLPSGHMGFPGAMLIRATYSILPGPILMLTILATSEDTTLCNFAQHSYFNLDGAETVADHRLTVPAENYLPVDADMIPLGAPAPVQGTHLDFRSPVTLGGRLGGPRIDHNLCISTQRRTTPRKVAVLQAGGLMMSLRSTEPGLQVYAGQHLTPGAAGVDGRPYGRHAGIALESQLWPDGPNHPAYPTTFLEPGQLYRQTTVMSFHPSP